LKKVKSQSTCHTERLDVTVGYGRGASAMRFL